jgi:hypothetical protein
VRPRTDLRNHLRIAQDRLNRLMPNTKIEYSFKYTFISGLDRDKTDLGEAYDRPKKPLNISSRQT